MAAPNLPKDFDAEAHKRSAKKFANSVPLRDTCDLDDPRENLAWMFVGMPGVNGAQLAFPISYIMVLSEALNRRGAMLKCEACGHMKEPEEVYVPPSASDPHWLTSPGRWVPRDKAPQPGSKIDEVVDNMPNPLKAAVYQRLRKQYEEGTLDA